MRSGVRNEPDIGPQVEGAVVTYSRLSSRGRRAADERREPILEAREVPFAEGDLRAFDPERAGDDFEKPPRGRGRRRRGGFGPVLIGTLALAVGMVLLAYAYGVATRVDVPSASTAGAPAPASDGAATIRATLPAADDAARSIPAPGDVPAPRTPDGTTEAAAPVPDGADGLPMDGQFALPADDGAGPAAAIPPAPEVAPPPKPDARPQPSKAAKAAPAEAAPAATQPVVSAPASGKPAAAASTDNQPAAGAPAGGSDDLIANIEKLLQRDGATAAGAGQPAAVAGQPETVIDQPAGFAGQPLDGAAAGGPTSVMPNQPTAGFDPNALPQLPDPGTLPVTQGGRLVPPADIPNVPPASTGTGLQ